MPRLVALPRPSSIALAGAAGFFVDASDMIGGLGNLEFWERTLPFPPAGTPAGAPPPFTLRTTPVSESPANPTVQPVPLGGVYQIRLFPQGRGSPALAENPQPPRLTLGALDFPSITRTQKTHLTSCGDKPRVMVTPGGTFVSIAFVSQTPTMARIQLLDRAPEVTSAGAAHPWFFEPYAIASAVSTGPAVVHRLCLVDQISGAVTAHIPLRTNQEVWFTVLAWDDQGHYDVVWNTTGLVPATPPEMVKTKQRVVHARLARLHCHDDSDELGSGSAKFTFGMTGGSAVETAAPYEWKPMSSGGMLEIPDFAANGTISPPNAAHDVRVWVDGTEDDTNSFPQDDDDQASTAGYLGGGLGRGTPLPFPVGRGREVVTDNVITLKSRPMTHGSDELGYSADIVYSIDYI